MSELCCRFIALRASFSRFSRRVTLRREASSESKLGSGAGALGAPKLFGVMALRCLTGRNTGDTRKRSPTTV